MANAIKKISVARGYDVTRYALACFGGAGGQHACMIADRLGMRDGAHPSAVGRALRLRHGPRRHPRHPQPGGGAAARRRRTWPSSKRCARSCATRSSPRSPARACAEDDIAISSARASPLRRHRHGAPGAVRDGRHRRDGRATSRRRTGRSSASSIEGKPIVAEAVEVEAAGGGARDRRAGPAARRRRAARRRSARASSPTAHGTTRGIYLREDLRPGQRIAGAGAHHRAAPDDRGGARLGGRGDAEGPHRAPPRVAARRARHAIGTDADPVMLEVFNNLFMSIAEQMGVTLQNTAYSVNIKERLDFSCALFDATGALVANAPHMPVHLGSMDRSVDIVRRLNPDISPGDVYALNAPYNGGTHLPDITVVTPVFEDARRTDAHPLLGRLARASRRCRRHRAGLDDAARHDRRRGRRADRQFQARRSRALPRGGAARAPDRPSLSLPQPGAEHRRPEGADRRQREGRRRRSARWCGEFGLDVVQAYMRHVRDNAAESVRRVHREAARFGVRISDRPGLGDQGEDHRRPARTARRRWISPAPRRRSRTISTPPPR